jgi:hypothetical protein
MNCNQFNSIKLEEVLVSLGHHPTKQNEKEAWYLNPFPQKPKPLLNSIKETTFGISIPKE